MRTAHAIKKKKIKKKAFDKRKEVRQAKKGYKS